MHVYDLTVAQYIKMLKNMDAWLDKAEAHAKAKSFDPVVFLSARLAPDQFSLVRQIQSASDAAKSSASHLAGKKQPAHPDTEQTWEEIRARIQTCLTYLETLKREEYDGADQRTITLPFLPGKAVRGGEYMIDMALPNFYFHVTTVYAILRNNGVDVGKRDFLGSVRTHDA
jgi:hypothetical protein